MPKLTRAVLALAVLSLAATPARAQDDPWRNAWFWGGQTGLYFYQTPTQNWEAAFEVGGHWLITRRQVGLHLAIDQIFFVDGATSAVPNSASAAGFTTVTFDTGQRIQASLYGMPLQGPFQVLLGGGLAIHRISDATPLDVITELEARNAFDAIAEFDTKAFLVVGGGAQWQIGRLAIFGNYQLMPGTDAFLVTSDQHAITGGVRFALTGSTQEVSTLRRR